LEATWKIAISIDSRKGIPSLKIRRLERLSFRICAGVGCQQGLLLRFSGWRGPCRSPSRDLPPAGAVSGAIAKVTGELALIDPSKIAVSAAAAQLDTRTEGLDTWDYQVRESAEAFWAPWSTTQANTQA